MRQVLAVLVGTRPEAIKLAPLLTELTKLPELRVLLVMTGQQSDGVRGYLAELGATWDLEEVRESQNFGLAENVGATIAWLASVFKRSAAGGVCVQGDTLTAFAGAWAAFLAEIPVIHLEAGLRTHDVKSPFPEEAFRVAISAITDLHLSPSETASMNLLLENSTHRVTQVGNTSIDALFQSISRHAIDVQPEGAPTLKTFSKLVLVEIHRRESWGAPMFALAEGIRTAALENADHTFVVLLHPNPKASDSLISVLAGTRNVFLTPPCSHSELIGLLARSSLLVTDSGGLQEEALYLGTPMLVVRKLTERPEVLESGRAQLLDPATEDLAEAITSRLCLGVSNGTLIRNGPYGDGSAGRLSAVAIRDFLKERYESDELLA